MTRALQVFRRLHAGLRQQGPGSDASTLRALGMLADLPPAPRVLDLGCGPGRQTLIASFELPESDWWDGYYGEIERRIERLRGEYSDRAAHDVLDAAQEEIDVFRARQGSYGYVFYVMRRPRSD